MLRDITLGQYYQTDSVLHRLDPRVKLIGTFAFIVGLFLAGNVAGYAVGAIFLGSMIKLSHVPVQVMLKGMKAIASRIVITVVFNTFMTPGEVLIQVWKLKVTKEGLIMAAKLAVRLSFLIVGSSIMTLTTTPNQLTDAIESVMGPLKRLHVPVHEVAMMMSIALRFIPILMEETDKIMKAQEARGASFDSGNLIDKTKALIPLLVPLFISAFRRANDLAMAMEARCYRGGDSRTKMKPLIYRRRDVLGYGVIISFLALVIVTRVLL